jgi:hypothetical protein
MVVNGMSLNFNQVCIRIHSYLQHSVAYIPIGILENIRKKVFSFLWKGKNE